jgi:ParB/RepB/Spo0J family partition protein
MFQSDQIVPLPMDKVLNDTEFNTRGEIIPFDVLTLSKNLAEVGLLQAICVQPWDKVPGKEYRIILGHRRYEAAKLLKWPTINATIKTGLSDEEALALNLIENVERSKLNILQEARGIYRFKLLGRTIREIADKVKMSPGWVQVRLDLLKLPVEIQKEAQADLLTTEHIKTLASMTRDEQFAALRQIKDSKLNNSKLVLKGKHKIKKPNPNEKKIRSPAEIEAMQDFIIDNLGNNLATRTLGWAGGYVTNIDFMKSLKMFAEQSGKTFTIPDEYL